ncbi:MAG: two-component sensor histidine kinase [Flammeovirgaceae bacterium]|nr:two-component sensor histidine kinase [Flammeovirgaceae bacterium]
MYRSRTMAIVLSLTISGIVGLVVHLSIKPEWLPWLLVVVLTFGASFALIFVSLESLIFGQIKTIYKMLNQLRKKDFAGLAKREPGSNPITNIKDEINFFANLKQKEIERLKKLEAFRKDFIANISHELKTPMFAAQGFVHTLQDGAINDPAVRDQFLTKAAKSLDDLDALVQDILTLSQIETGEIKMKFETFDLYKLAMELVDQFEPKVEEKKLELIVVKPTKPVLVIADRLRISQVLTNLISNSVNYTSENGKVEIRFMVGKKKVVTFVKDNGEGIPEEDLHRIFERFYRVDRSRSRTHGGTGLGLAIVKHILEVHKTKATVTSKIGKGSVFSFKLPKSENQTPH